MNPAVRSIKGNVITLARRDELTRQADVDAAVQRALVEAIRARPPRSQYAQTDKLIRRCLWTVGGFLLVYEAVSALVMAGG